MYEHLYFYYKLTFEFQPRLYAEAIRDAMKIYSVIINVRICRISARYVGWFLN